MMSLLKKIKSLFAHKDDGFTVMSIEMFKKRHKGRNDIKRVGWSGDGFIGTTKSGKLVMDVDAFRFLFPAVNS